MIMSCLPSGVLQAYSEGVVSRGREAEHRPGSAAAVPLRGEQGEELQRHQRLHAGRPAQRYSFMAGLI